MMADDSTTTLANGAKLIGEAVLPGASLLMDGRIREGAVHAIVGVGARMMLGPYGMIGALLVAADSFSKSVTNRNIWDHVPDASEEPAPALSGPAPTGKGGASA
ncbi:MAG TPA: DUF6072 family protein [Allosphingosinicella sp.]|jgi:hypothetical protein